VIPVTGSLRDRGMDYLDSVRLLGQLEGICLRLARDEILEPKLQARAIWVVSRADPEYPRRLKSLLKEDAPPILYGCGEIGLLESGGLAVVGSRHVDESLIEYTIGVGRLVARSGRTIVSGGAKGIDQAAMRGALEAGGKSIGVLADILERTAMNRENRNLLVDDKLVLVSPYDPGAGFNVGHAMQRNKLIYAFADAALVVSADYNKGGTWAGAIEQLEGLRFGPLFVRSSGQVGPGLEALRRKGALPWPDPADVASLEHIWEIAQKPMAATSAQSPLTLSAREPEPVVIGHSEEPPGSDPDRGSGAISHEPWQTSVRTPEEGTSEAGPGLADTVFATVRAELCRLLVTPMKDKEVATALQVLPAQAKVWLNRLVEEGVLEKKKRPAGYVVRSSGLFG
jgi:DNA processing protein